MIVFLIYTKLKLFNSHDKKEKLEIVKKANNERTKNRNGSYITKKKKRIKKYITLLVVKVCLFLLVRRVLALVAVREGRRGVDVVYRLQADRLGRGGHVRVAGSVGRVLARIYPTQSTLHIQVNDRVQELILLLGLNHARALRSQAVHGLVDVNVRVDAVGLDLVEDVVDDDYGARAAYARAAMNRYGLL